jgi:hypothetical protein
VAANEVAVEQAAVPFDTLAVHRVIAPDWKLTVPVASEGSPETDKETVSPCGAEAGVAEADIE